MSNDNNCNLCDQQIKINNSNDELSFKKICKCSASNICAKCSVINSNIHGRKECPYCKGQYNNNQIKQIDKNMVHMSKVDFADCVIAYWLSTRSNLKEFNEIFNIYLQVNLNNKYHCRFITFIQYGGCRIVKHSSDYYILTSDVMIKRIDIIHPLFEIFDIKGVIVYQEEYNLTIHNYIRDDDGRIILQSPDDELTKLYHDKIKYLAGSNPWHIKYWKLLREYAFILDDDIEKIGGLTPNWYINLIVNEGSCPLTTDDDTDDDDNDDTDDDDADEQILTTTQRQELELANTSSNTSDILDMIEHMRNIPGSDEKEETISINHIASILRISSKYGIDMNIVKEIIDHYDNFDIESIEHGQRYETDNHISLILIEMHDNIDSNLYEYDVYGERALKICITIANKYSLDVVVINDIIVHYDEFDIERIRYHHKHIKLDIRQYLMDMHDAIQLDNMDEFTMNNLDKGVMSNAEIVDIIENETSYEGLSGGTLINISEIKQPFDDGVYGFEGHDAGHFIMQDNEFIRIYNPCDTREGCTICKDMYTGIVEDLHNTNRGTGHFLVRCDEYQQLYNPCINKENCTTCDMLYDVDYDY